MPGQDGHELLHGWGSGRRDHHLRRRVGVVRREAHVEVEAAERVGRRGRADDHRVPVVDVGLLRRGEDHRHRLRRHVAQLAHQPARARGHDG